MLINRLSLQRRREIDRIARETADHVSDNPFIVASRAGISINHLPYEAWHALGLLRKSRAGFAIYLVSPLKPKQRRLILTHLLGHWVLHRSYYNSIQTFNWCVFGNILWPSRKGPVLSRENQEADAFAAGYLMAAADGVDTRTSLTELHRKTGLPKSLIRIHQTLGAEEKTQPWIRKQKKRATI